MWKDNEFFCNSCKEWRPMEDWIVTRSLGNSDADYCSNCVQRPTEDQLEEFNKIIRELS